jgi:hypothetical protein
MPLMPRAILASSTARVGLAALVLAALPTTPLAADAPVYRCGNTYSPTPCPGGAAVQAADARTEAQRREAQDAHRREAALAEQLAAERQARERAAQKQVAARIGPAAAPLPPPAASKPKPLSHKKKSAKAPKKPKPQATKNNAARPADTGRLGAL